MSLAVLLGRAVAARSRRPGGRGARGVRELLPLGATARPARRLDATVAGRAQRLRPACRAPAARLRGGGRGRRRRADPGGERRRRRPRSSADPSVLAVGAVNVALTNAGLRTRVLDRGRGGRRARVASRGVPLAVGAEAVGSPLAAAPRSPRSRAAPVTTTTASPRRWPATATRSRTASARRSPSSASRAWTAIAAPRSSTSWGSTTRSRGRVSSPRRTALGGAGTGRRRRRRPRATVRAFGTADAVAREPGLRQVPQRRGAPRDRARGGASRASDRGPALSGSGRTHPARRGRSRTTDGRRSRAEPGRQSAGAARAVRGYAASMHARPPTAIRDLLELVPGETAVPLDEVEAGGRDPRAARPAPSRTGRSRRRRTRRSRSPCNAIGGRSNTRRGRRGSRAVPNRQELQDQADRVGALRRHARVLRRSPTSSRSRSRRARSPARAASCRATR